MDTKKLSGLILLIFILLVSVGVFAYYSVIKQSIDYSQGVEVDDTKDWKTYRNEEYGFEFKYPADWNLHSTRTGASVLTKEHDGGVGPSGKAVDFSASACDLKQSNCLEEREYLSKIKEKYELMQRDWNVIIDGKIGYQGIITGAGYYYYIVIEDKGVLFVLRSDVEDYNTQYPDAISNSNLRQILSTFKFTE